MVTPQSFTMASRPARSIRSRSSRPHGRCAPRSSPDPPGFELAEVLRGFTTLVPRVHLPVSLAGPAPSGSPGASRRCRGCSPPDPADSPNPATPSFNRPAATERRRGSHTRTQTHSASWRTVSHLHSINKRLTAHRRKDAGPFASSSWRSATARSRRRHRGRRWRGRGHALGSVRSDGAAQLGARAAITRCHTCWPMIVR
jgi:hypothetical protein